MLTSDYLRKSNSLCNKKVIIKLKIIKFSPMTFIFC